MSYFRGDSGGPVGPTITLWKEEGLNFPALGPTLVPQNGGQKSQNRDYEHFCQAQKVEALKEPVVEKF